MAGSKNAKNNVLPHSKAKLDLYKSYLERYLPILGLSEFVTAINIFDIFCGTGIYDDGKEGSPLIAANCIKDYEDKIGARKLVRLTVNDFDSEKVVSVKQLLDQVVLKNCQVQAFNLDATDMLNLVAKQINSLPKTERSLVFIDPYGYSKITRESIDNILQSGKSEIILFLPVAHMKRFSDDALSDLDNKSYENLRRFIYDFVPPDSPIITGRKMTVFEYIEELRKSFSLRGSYYTASYYIERDARNYYSLFFISSHVRGLEKFIEAKWSNAPLGKGFKQRNQNITLWGDAQEEEDKLITHENLEKILRERLSQREAMSNVDLYLFALENQFRPIDLAELLKKLLKERRIQVLDQGGNPLEKIKSSSLTYSNYKNRTLDFTVKKNSYGSN